MYEDQALIGSAKGYADRVDLDHIKQRLSDLPSQIRDMEICARAAADKLFGVADLDNSLKEPTAPSAPKHENLFTLVQEIEKGLRELRVQVVRF